jgi:F-type H+-transporting ATPase subunit b
MLWMALPLGIVAVPSRLSAQSTPSPAVAETKSGEKSLQKQEQDSEEESTNVYRHSPTVEWVARTLHVDVETAARGFEIINFAIIFLAVGIPLVKVLPKVLRQRKVRLSAELEVAQAKTADANERLSAVEAKLAGLDAEISAIRKQVEEEIKSDEARIKTSIEEESARIVAAAEQEIVMAGAHAQRGLKQFVADLAIDRALSQLTLDAETDRALIAEFANDVSGKHGNKRQQARDGNGGRA